MNSVAKTSKPDTSKECHGNLLNISSHIHHERKKEDFDFKISLIW